MLESRSKTGRKASEQQQSRGKPSSKASERYLQSLGSVQDHFELVGTYLGGGADFELLGVRVFGWLYLGEEASLPTRRRHKQRLLVLLAEGASENGAKQVPGPLPTSGL